MKVPFPETRAIIWVLARALFWSVLSVAVIAIVFAVMALPFAFGALWGIAQVGWTLGHITLPEKGFDFLKSRLSEFERKGPLLQQPKRQP